MILEAEDQDLSLDAVIYCYIFLSSLKLSYMICEMGLIKSSIQAEGQLE